MSFTDINNVDFLGREGGWKWVGKGWSRGGIGSKLQNSWQESRSHCRRQDFSPVKEMTVPFSRGDLSGYCLATVALTAPRPLRIGLPKGYTIIITV